MPEQNKAMPAKKIKFLSLAPLTWKVMIWCIKCIGESCENATETI